MNVQIYSKTTELGKRFKQTEGNMVNLGLCQAMNLVIQKGKALKAITHIHEQPGFVHIIKTRVLKESNFV